jgi:hypothetical protein
MRLALREPPEFERALVPDTQHDPAETTLLYVEVEPLPLVDVEAALTDAGFKVVAASTDRMRFVCWTIAKDEDGREFTLSSTT